MREIGSPSSLYTQKSAVKTGLYYSKEGSLYCSLRLVHNIEIIGHSDTNIDWSSPSRLTGHFELLRTVFFYIFELHNYVIYMPTLHVGACSM